MEHSKKNFVRLQVNKDYFRFNAAHFTVFKDPNSRGFKRELLHGHNYRITVRLGGFVQENEPFLAHITEIKDVVKAVCNEFHEKIFIPTKCPFSTITYTDGGKTVKV